MSIVKNINYRSPFVTEKRVFYNHSSFLSFFNKNRNIIESIKVNPPKLGSKHYGSIEVKVKPSKNVSKKII